MEASAPAPVVGGRREPSTDPVKAQGILKSVTKKNKAAARLWPERWGFYSQISEIQKEEAAKIGMTAEEYETAVRLRSSQPEPDKDLIILKPSPAPMPPTSAGMVGRRALCSLEKYGRLVKTARDYPTKPPLKPAQIYDPFKQTLIFLGSVEGDPISYKLPYSRCEVTNEMWAKPQNLEITPFDFDNLNQV